MSQQSKSPLDTIVDYIRELEESLRDVNKKLFEVESELKELIEINGLREHTIQLMTKHKRQVDSELGIANERLSKVVGPQPFQQNYARPLLAAKKTIEEHEKTIEAYKISSDALLKQLSESNNSALKANMSLVSIKGTNKSLRGELMGKTREYLEATYKVKGLEEQVEELETKVTGLKETTQEHESKREDLERRLDDISTAVSDIEYDFEL